MRMNEVTRYLDLDNLSDRLERLQARLAKVGELVPYRRQRRGYGLPTALILGGIAALGAIAITSVAIRQIRSVQYPEETGYRG